MQAPEQLLKNGRLRAGLFLPQFRKDAASGRTIGVGTGVVGIEMTRELASRLGIEGTILEYATPSEALAAIQHGDCDIAFMGIEPEREAQLDFTAPAFQFDYTYLVPAGSGIARIADADRPGIRISAVGNHASTNTLAGQLRHAEIVCRKIPDEAFALLVEGAADAFAMPREILVEYAPKLPGSKVLDDRFGVNRVGICMAKGQPELLACLCAFVEEAKASGLIANAIAQHDMPFFVVAPASG